LPCRSARAFIITKKTGTRISTFIVEVIMPPTIGAAIGFITSDPTPVSHRIGTRLAKNSRDRHQFGTQALDGARREPRPAVASD
jgi:hypothetical protein